VAHSETHNTRQAILFVVQAATTPSTALDLRVGLDRRFETLLSIFSDRGVWRKREVQKWVFRIRMCLQKEARDIWEMLGQDLDWTTFHSYVA
jgi:hypothetical protein